MSLFALVTNRSSIAPLLVGLSITCLKKLSSMHYSAYACQATFPADVGVIEVPQQDKSLQVQCILYLEYAVFINRLPLRGWPVVDTKHKVAFIALLSDSYP